METTSAGPNGRSGTEGALVAALDRIERRLARVEAALKKADAATKTPVTERLDVLERALALADQLPGLVAMTTDTFDGVARSLRDAGVDLDDRGKNLLRAVERLTSPPALEVLHALLDRVDVVHTVLESGVFDRAPAAVVSCAGAALAATGRESPPPVGFWGAMRALNDPDVQRALGFALRVAQRFGGSLAEGTCPPPQLAPSTQQ